MSTFRPVFGERGACHIHWGACEQGTECYCTFSLGANRDRLPAAAVAVRRRPAAYFTKPTHSPIHLTTCPPTHTLALVHCVLLHSVQGADGRCSGWIAATFICFVYCIFENKLAWGIEKYHLRGMVTYPCGFTGRTTYARLCCRHRRVFGTASYNACSFTRTDQLLDLYTARDAVN